MVRKLVKATPPKISVKNLRLSYGESEVIHGISFDVEENQIFSVIGPA
jgi:ABC-type phosphate transport system ATPase subunit